jgi:hypothetical protein
LKHFVKGKGYIRFYPVYAEYRSPYWEAHHKKDYSDSLGKIIDRKNNIFYKKEYGFYRFTVDEGITPVDDNEIPIEKLELVNKTKRKKYTGLDFGDVYTCYEYLKSISLIDIFASAFPGNQETLISLIMHHLTCDEPNYLVEKWKEHSISSILFPNSAAKSQRITDFLKRLGDVAYTSDFFDNYFEYLKKFVGKKLIIDSTGLKNKIKSDFTALSTHNNISSMEIRFILVLDKVSHLPVYFRIIPGNIVDSTTLERTLNQMSGYINKNVSELIMDAGYETKKNIDYLLDKSIPFLIRLPSNRSLYKKLVLAIAPRICSTENLVQYEDRTFYIKKVSTRYSDATIDETLSSENETSSPDNETSFSENETSSSENETKDKVIAYVIFEASRLNDDLKDFQEYYRTHSAPAITSEETTKEIDEIKAKIIKFDENKNFKFLNCGIFIFISSIDVPISSILPLYYTRQEVEQLIDKFKNNCNSIPLKVHSDSAIRGHLFLSFLTLIACCEITNKLKKFNYGINFIMTTLRGLKCTVKNDWVDNRSY